MAKVDLRLLKAYCELAGRGEFLQNFRQELPRRLLPFLSGDSLRPKIIGGRASTLMSGLGIIE